MDEPGFPTSEIIDEFSKMMHRLTFKEDDPNWNICWEMFLQQKSVRLVEQSIHDFGITPEIQKSENKSNNKSEKEVNKHAELLSNSFNPVLIPQVQELFSIPLETPIFCTPKLNPNIPSFVPATAPPSSVTVSSASAVQLRQKYCLENETTINRVLLIGFVQEFHRTILDFCIFYFSK